MRKYINWTSVLILLISIILLAGFYARSELNKLDDSLPPVEEEDALESEFDGLNQTLPPILDAIAFCESSGRQFNEDGSVVTGKINPYDIGKWQINILYHGDRAKELGIDLYTEEGNREFALLLYNEQGTKPWSWSSSCWS